MCACPYKHNGFKKMVGLSQTDKCRFCKTETESTSHLLSGCKKLLSEQLYIQWHNKLCKVVSWHICKIFNIPVPENSWRHEPRAIIENKDVMFTFEMMIPSSMNLWKTKPCDRSSFSGTKRKRQHC